MTYRNAEKHAALNAWRRRYETDPAVTLRKISVDIGMSRHYVGVIIREYGWHRPESVRQAAKEIYSQLTKERNSMRGLRLPAMPPEPAPNYAASPSVWAFASASAVTTARPHIEVSI